MMKWGGFKLGDKAAKDLNLIFEYESERPIAPNTRDSTMVIDGKAGAWDFGAERDVLSFNLQCGAIRKDRAALQQTVRALSAHLFDARGRPRTMKLTFEYEPEKWYYVRYSGSLPINRIVGVGEFTLPLTAFDPDAYAEANAYDETYQYDTGVQYDSGLIYPNTASFHWQYFRHMSSLYNYGNLNTGLRVFIEGAVSSPNLTHFQTGEKIAFNVTLDKDEALIIDSDTFTAVKCTVESETYYVMAQYPARYVEYEDAVSVIGRKRGDFFQLIPGENGLIFGGVNPDAVVKYMWYNKFS